MFKLVIILISIVGIQSHALDFKIKVPSNLINIKKTVPKEDGAGSIEAPTFGRDDAEQIDNGGSVEAPRFGG